VLAPSGVQELYELTVDAFNLADKYRMLVMILADGTTGQMMEPVLFSEEEKIEAYDKKWAASGRKGSPDHHTITVDLYPAGDSGRAQQPAAAKYRVIERDEVRVERMNCEDAEIIITAFGTCASIAKNVIKEAGKLGIKVGLIRPVTFWPFPTDVIAAAAAQDSVRCFFDLELNAGQMVEDVRLAVNGRRPVYFYGRTGGMIPTHEEVLAKIVESQTS
jgi:2-oxoglutarate/2-oxoacid ferredoxin oxidoreductase subunit alpha